MNSLGPEIFLFQLLLALALGLLIIVFAKNARADVSLEFDNFRADQSRFDGLHQRSFLAGAGPLLRHGGECFGKAGRELRPH